MQYCTPILWHCVKNLYGICFVIFLVQIFGGVICYVKCFLRLVFFLGCEIFFKRRLKTFKRRLTLLKSKSSHLWTFQHWNETTLETVPLFFQRPILGWLRVWQVWKQVEWLPFVWFARTQTRYQLEPGFDTLTQQVSGKPVDMSSMWKVTIIQRIWAIVWHNCIVSTLLFVL